MSNNVPGLLDNAMQTISRYWGGGEYIRSRRVQRANIGLAGCFATFSVEFSEFFSSFLGRVGSAERDYLPGLCPAVASALPGLYLSAEQVAFNVELKQILVKLKQILVELKQIRLAGLIGGIGVTIFFLLYPEFRPSPCMKDSTDSL